MRLYLPCLALFLSGAVAGALPSLAQYPGAGNGQPAPAATSQQSILEWFNRYDIIRRQAQMNPADRAKADAMMGKGLSVIIPGEEKASAQAFLSKLVQKNSAAAEQLKQLPLFPETEYLHKGYYQYFSKAAQLFRDYITVQNNLFAADSQGKALAGGLVQRKQDMEELDRRNKELDGQIRQKFNVPAYRY